MSSLSDFYKGLSQPGDGGNVPSVTSVNTRTGDVVLTEDDVGLSEVDNTSDVNKPISTAAQTALNLKAPLLSPVFTGTPTVPTQSPGDNTTNAASTAFVSTAVSTAIGGVVGSKIIPLGEIYNQTKTDANVTETILWTLSIPGGSIGIKDKLVVESYWENPNSATTKTFKAKYNGVTFHTDQNTTQTALQLSSTLTNLGVTNSQRGQIGFSGGAFNGTNNAPALTQDTTATLNLTLTTTWGTAGTGTNTITLVWACAYILTGV